MTNNTDSEKVKEIYKNFELLERKLKEHYSIRDIFSDFCILSMASLHNQIYSIGKMPIPSCYKATHDKLEAEYLEVINKYKRDDEATYRETISMFAKILAELNISMKENPFDYLGAIYMEINMNSKYKGQYFTPSHICDMMAEMTIENKEDFDKIVKEKGYFAMADPCCGSGSLVIRTLRVLKNRGIENLDAKLYIQLQDIDLTCVRMAYINMCLLETSSRVIWGNSLLIDENYPFFDTPCLQVGLMMGLFQGKDNQNKSQAKNDNQIKSEIQSKPIILGEQLDLFNE